jgi:hypothetical protein
MMQPDCDTIRKCLNFAINPLIRTPMRGVLHDIAGRLLHRWLKSDHVVFIERLPRKRAAEVTDEFAAIFGHAGIQPLGPRLRHV